MWSTSEHFAGYEQQDAHEFLIAALQAIDAGLAQPRRSPTAPWDALCPVVPGGIGGKAEAALGSLEGKADLARTFTGVLRSEVTCLKCRGRSTKFEEFQANYLQRTKIKKS